MPLLLAACAGIIWHGLRRGKPYSPFFGSLGIFILSYAGVGISFFPYIVPGALTIHEAAGSDSSLGFLLIGASVLIPVILAYTAYAYFVFRGKIDPKEGYH